jgi:hypothetical protein
MNFHKIKGIVKRGLNLYSWSEKGDRQLFGKK